MEELTRRLQELEDHILKEGRKIENEFHGKVSIDVHHLKISTVPKIELFCPTVLFSIQSSDRY